MADKTVAISGISIYDVQGALIKKCRIRAEESKISAHWTGVSNNNKPVSNGCYIVTVESHGKRINQRINLYK